MPPSPKTNALDKPVGSLRGVGPERVAHLARLGIHTVEDLLLHQPRRYEDRRHLISIREMKLSEAATTRGRIVAQGLKRYHHGEKSVFEIILDDGTARLHCRWWNLPFMEKYFQVGEEVVVFGKPAGLKPRTIDHPETEVVENGEENFIHLNRITANCPLTEGLPQRWLRSLIWRTLAKFESQISDPWTGQRTAAASESKESLRAGTVSPSPPPREERVGERRPFTRASLNPVGVQGAPPPSPFLPHTSPLPTRSRAIHLIHFPEETEDIELARRRLALDEFVGLQRQIQLRRRNFETKSQAFPCGGDNHLMKPVLAQLGFKLTAAQTSVLRELRKDLAGPHPMRRLLQGDVGSGKTAVAACCALMALESGYNVALMVPTEILAEQHFRNFTKWFTPLGVPVELQTGSQKTAPSPKSKVQSSKSGTTSNIQYPASSIEHPASSNSQPSTL